MKLIEIVRETRGWLIVVSDDETDGLKEYLDEIRFPLRYSRSFNTFTFPDTISGETVHEKIAYYFDGIADVRIKDEN